MSKHEPAILPLHGSRPSPLDGDTGPARRQRAIRMVVPAHPKTCDDFSPGRIAILSSVVDLVGAFIADWREYGRLRRERSRAAREIAALDDRVLRDAGLPSRSNPPSNIAIDRFMAPPHAAGLIAPASDMYPKERD